jgi:hypothetical protein
MQVVGICWYFEIVQQSRTGSELKPEALFDIYKSFEFAQDSWVPLISLSVCLTILGYSCFSISLVETSLLDM